MRLAILSATLTIALAALGTGPARGDAPLPLPVAYTVTSPNRQFAAQLDPAAGLISVSRLAEGGAVPIWQMPGWFRLAALADDGDHLVVGFDGLNLVPLDYSTDIVLLSFYGRGRLIRDVTLGEIIADTSQLQRTVSHFHWGNYLGFDDDGHYRVKTVEDRVIAFDVTTGMEVAGQR